MLFPCIFELTIFQKYLILMRNKNLISLLSSLIILLAGLASALGIYLKGDDGSYTYQSIRGEKVEVYGRGLYQHMSADVAIQGIAQDYVTLFAAIPLLIIALTALRNGSFRARFVLAGTLGYFFVTYLFYTAMAMYNFLFLVYVALLGLSFFALINTLLSFDLKSLKERFKTNAPRKWVGGFLIFSSIAIALLWLSVVVPPLLEGNVYPESLQHYTTLIVQGFDLGLLLPISFVNGVLLVKNRALGYLAGTTFIVFLAILMTALTAKVIAMMLNGDNVIPVIFIIPTFNLVAIICAIGMVRGVRAQVSD
ncbi:MAG: hypothetical protein U5L96_13155 [Owenweeksia sp.]|nr:hypothetical protein [Owenweeksia sp.]